MYWKFTFNANFSYKVPGDDHKCGRVFDLHIENSAYVCAWEENFSNDLHFLTVFKYTFQYATLSISEIFKSWLFLVTESIKCCSSSRCKKNSSSRCKHFSNLQLFWMNKRSFIALYPNIWFFWKILAKATVNFFSVLQLQKNIVIQKENYNHSETVDFNKCGNSINTWTVLFSWNLWKIFLSFNKECALFRFDLWMDARVSDSFWIIFLK